MLELLINSDFIEKIYKYLPYLSIINIKKTSGLCNSNITNSKVAMDRLENVDNYFSYVEESCLDITRYIKAIGKFRDDILSFDIMSLYVDVFVLDTSLPEFIMFYYKEFGLDIMNNSDYCLGCGNFNFIDDNIQCHICSCNDILSAGKTITSKFQTKEMLEYSLVTNLSFV